MKYTFDLLKAMSERDEPALADLARHALVQLERNAVLNRLVREKQTKIVALELTIRDQRLELDRRARTIAELRSGR